MKKVIRQIGIFLCCLNIQIRQLVMASPKANENTLSRCLDHKEICIKNQLKTFGWENIFHSYRLTDGYAKPPIYIYIYIYIINAWCLLSWLFSKSIT